MRGLTCHMSKDWILQKKSFGLGNFVMATPALRLLSQKRGEKINVFFSTPSIAELYRKCPFINILSRKPSFKEFFCIGKMKRSHDESDIQSFCRILKVGQKNISSTYVDPVNTIQIKKMDGKKTFAIFHGCLGEHFRKKKDIGVITRKYILDKLTSSGFRVLLLGTNQDYKNYWIHNNLDNIDNCLGCYSLVDTVSLLNQCDAFISNDTGLYHVASALGKKGLVLWKKTDYIKNKSHNNRVSHCINKTGVVDIYIKEIDNFVSGVMK